MKIIYPNSPYLVVLTPSGLLSLNETASKDVPFGVPYLIVDDSDIPVDRTFQEAWEANFSNPDGYGLGPQRWFIERAEKEIELINDHEPTDDPVLQKERADAIEKNRALIAQMKEEIFQIEGVRL